MIKKILAVLACSMAAHGAAAVTPADLQWDLTYRSVLAAHPIGEHELLNHWKYAGQERWIHRELAEYNGEPILAAVLMEGPSMYFSTEPVGGWTFRTRSGVVECIFARGGKKTCKPLDPEKFDAMVRKLIQLKPLAPREIGMPHTLNDGAGLLDDCGYAGFISIHVDGKSAQWPTTVKEGGSLKDRLIDGADSDVSRLTDIYDELRLTEAELAGQRERVQAVAARDALRVAIRAGDLARVDRLLREQGGDSKALLARFPAVADAAGAGRRHMVDALLARGAEVRAFGDEAVRAAVTARDGGMVEYLRSRGARIDAMGPRLIWVGDTTPLTTAVMQRNVPMAEHLIRDGVAAGAEAPYLPLLLALRNLDYPMTDLLLRSGADPNGVGDHYPHVPFSFLVYQSTRAAGREADIARLMRRLVSAGAVIDRPGEHCMTAYDVARSIQSTAMEKLLRELGADPEAGRRCRAEQKVKG